MLCMNMIKMICNIIVMVRVSSVSGDVVEGGEEAGEADHDNLEIRLELRCREEKISGKRTRILKQKILQSWPAKSEVFK